MFLEAQNDTCSNRRRQRSKARKEREINVPVTSLPSLSRDSAFSRFLMCLCHLKVLISTHQRSLINRTGTERGCIGLCRRPRVSTRPGSHIILSRTMLPASFPTPPISNFPVLSITRNTFWRNVLLCPCLVSDVYSFVTLPEHLKVPHAFFFPLWGERISIRKQG